ncbi:MAG: O-antigen ligase family protein [Chthoniobacteraceae bacterium]
MNFAYLAFVVVAWVEIECFIGGTRLVYSLPAYGLIAIGAVLTLFSLRSKRVPPNGFCLLSTLILGAWILARAWHSPIPYLAWPDFFMMVACLMMYLLTAFHLTGQLERTVLIVVLWLIAGLEVWVGMIQFLKTRNFMLFGLLRPDSPRASGMYISPNNFAGLLVAVAILSISLGVWSRWKIWIKVFAFYIAACCFVGVAMSGSRGGYFDSIGSLLCFAVGSIYAIRAIDPRKFLPVTLISLGSIAVVIAGAAFLMFHSDYLTRRMHTMVVKDVRIYNWEAALDHIRLSPWIGTGSGTHLIYGRLFRRPPIQVDPVHAHCDYLELLAEYGIVGAACMALFLTAHIRNALRSYSEILRHRLIPSGINQSNAFAMQLGALCAVVGLGIHSVVDFDMHIPGNALIFAFIFGVLANPGIQRPAAGFVDRRLTPWAKILPPALGVFMIWYGLPLLPAEYYSEVSRRALRDRNYLASIMDANKALNPVVQKPADADDPAAPPSWIDRILSRTGPEPENPDLYFYIGEANRALGDRMPNRYLKKGYYRQAISAFQDGLKVFPQDESMLVREAQSLDNLGRFDEAEAAYQRALAWDPNLGLLHQYYEVHLRVEGNTEKALEDQRRQPAPAVVPMEPQDELRLQTQ